MGQHLYVYYKVYKPLPEEIYSQSKWLVSSMHAHCDQSALRRRVENEAYETWMQVYEGVKDNFRTCYAQCLAMPECSAFRRIERHEEWFEDVPDRV